MRRRPEPARAIRPKISVRTKNGPHGVSAASIRLRAGKMLAALDRIGAELSVLLVDDTFMRDLNQSYRGIDRSTDVLSFSMLEGEYGEVSPQLLGDVVICVPTARRQADRGERALLDEITHLLAHGLLHLVGLDHDTKEAERIMRAETVRLCASAGRSHGAGRE